MLLSLPLLELNLYFSPDSDLQSEKGPAFVKGYLSQCGHDLTLEVPEPLLFPLLLPLPFPPCLPLLELLLLVLDFAAFA